MTDIRDEVAAALVDALWRELMKAGYDQRFYNARGDEHTRTDAEGYVATQLAALAARGLTVVREGELDVERLARALQETILTAQDKYLGPGMGAYRTPWSSLTARQKRHVGTDAEALASAYARLTRQSEGQ